MTLHTHTHMRITSLTSSLTNFATQQMTRQNMHKRLTKSMENISQQSKANKRHFKVFHDQIAPMHIFHPPNK